MGQRRRERDDREVLLRRACWREQIIDQERARGRKHQPALEGIAKLPHVARPEMAPQSRAYVRRQRRYRKAVAHRETREERLGQKLHVSLALAERGEDEGHDVETEIQVL